MIPLAGKDVKALSNKFQIPLLCQRHNADHGVTL